MDVCGGLERGRGVRVRVSCGVVVSRGGDLERGCEDVIEGEREREKFERR